MANTNAGTAHRKGHLAMVLSTLRTVFSPLSVLRVVFGWAAVLGLVILQPVLAGQLSTTTIFLMLAGIVTSISFCAFGVVYQAELLAKRLGDPVGTLVLTLSIVVIEVALISAVMLGPGEHSTVARDSVMAVSMIVLNFVVGIGLLIGDTKRRELYGNPVGASIYICVLIVFFSLIFALPKGIGTQGAYDPWQAVIVLSITLIFYAYFLYRQIGTQRADFRQPVQVASGPMASKPPVDRTDDTRPWAAHGPEIACRILLLVITMFPIVLLSHDMAGLLDRGLERIGAPTALSGIVIAAIVFLPETIAAVRAARLGEIQRMSNLCHGALVSTIGLTVPMVILIGLWRTEQVVLAESPENLLLLGMSLLLTKSTFTGKRITALHGGAHLATFVIYLLVVFS